MMEWGAGDNLTKGELRSMDLIIKMLSVTSETAFSPGLGQNPVRKRQ